MTKHNEEKVIDLSASITLQSLLIGFLRFFFEIRVVKLFFQICINKWKEEEEEKKTYIYIHQSRQFFIFVLEKKEEEEEEDTLMYLKFKRNLFSYCILPGKSACGR